MTDASLRNFLYKSDLVSFPKKEVASVYESTVTNHLFQHTVTRAFLVVCLGNSDSLTAMTILRDNPSKLIWTIPCFPVMTVDFKRVSLLFKRQEVKKWKA